MPGPRSLYDVVRPIHGSIGRHDAVACAQNDDICSRVVIHYRYVLCCGILDESQTIVPLQVYVTCVPKAGPDGALDRGIRVWNHEHLRTVCNDQVELTVLCDSGRIRVERNGQRLRISAIREIVRCEHEL